MEFVLVAVFVIAFGAHFALRRVFFDRLRPNRDVWWQIYGRSASPVDSVWGHRRSQMDERQRERAVSQAAKTRIL